MTMSCRFRGRVAVVLGLAAVLVAAPAVAQLVLRPVVIDEQPQPATVLSGEGAVFSVTARVVGGSGFISQIVWRDGAGRVVQSGFSPTLRRTAWLPADAGDYTATVHHSGGYRVTSQPARLTVLQSGWAPVGGRALTRRASPRQPALELCDAPVLAWVETLPTGQRELRTHRFDGAAWQPMGTASLLIAPGGNPQESSLQCTRNAGTPTPVLAFAEGWTGGGAVHVRRWTGTAWTPVGLTGNLNGTSPRAPQLRALPSSEENLLRDGLPLWSWLAWQENTGLQVNYWPLLSDWESHGGGLLPGSSFGPPVLAVDSVTRLKSGERLLLPLLGTIEVGPLGSQPVVMVPGALGGGWGLLGLPPAEPVFKGLRAVGLGFTTENAAPRVVMVWTEGGSAFTLRSASLFDDDYRTAVIEPFPRQPWGRYAADYTGTGLVATAFDPQPFDRSCRGIGPDSFTVALATTLGVDVVMSRCTGGPAQWERSAARLRVDSPVLALKMVDAETPLVATVSPDGFGGWALTVWKHRP